MKGKPSKYKSSAKHPYNDFQVEERTGVQVQDETYSSPEISKGILLKDCHTCNWNNTPDRTQILYHQNDEQLIEGLKKLLQINIGATLWI